MIANEYKARWQRLYSFARLTRQINRGLLGDVLKGHIRPHQHIDGFVLNYLSRKGNGTRKNQD